MRFQDTVCTIKNEVSAGKCEKIREETIRKVCVLFKTHFDYGYTALARDVYDRYMNQYIPAALSRAEEMRAEGEHRFI